MLGHSHWIHHARHTFFMVHAEKPPDINNEFTLYYANTSKPGTQNNFTIIWFGNYFLSYSKTPTSIRWISSNNLQVE
jgi:hypothetical protein